MSATSSIGPGYWATRPFKELKAEILDRVGHRSPFVLARRKDAERALARLRSVAHEDWVAAWSAPAEEYERRAREAESEGRAEQAREAYQMAWTYFSIARYPCPSSESKRGAFDRGRQAYLAMMRYAEHPFERVELPFPARPGEGASLPLYLHRPRGVERPPVVLMSGGIDQFKEEGHTWAQKYLEESIAAAVYDMPGTGESPVVGSVDAERIFDVMLEHLAGRADLDGSRIAVVGRSFGGYWATKAAHTHGRWLTAAVNWGGAVHHFFDRDWQRRSQDARSYLFELLETRAHAFGLRSAEEFVEASPQFSLLGQGVLERDSPPFLAVNGKEDQQVPIQDLYLLLEHGSPKSARVFPGGHLGPVPVVDGVVRQWVKARLTRPRAG